jgi:hypothetical protein
LTWLVLAFGIAIGVLGGFGIARPTGLVEFVQRFWQKPSGLALAVGIRLALGIVLLAAAPECRFPAAIRVLGGVSLVAALAVPLVGREGVRSLVAWWVERPPAFIRIWASFALAFGGFLVFASR